jgi:hypothetical protein
MLGRRHKGNFRKKYVSYKNANMDVMSCNWNLLVFGQLDREVK